MSFYRLSWVVIASLVMSLFSIARGPDKELHFYRETYSASRPEILQSALQQTSLWPKWFYSLEKVTELTPDSQEITPSSPLLSGKTLRLYFNDRKSPWSAMQITVQVLESAPSRIALKILNDSKGKLTRLFDHLEWKIELQPVVPSSDQGPQIIVIGKAWGHTSHWRSRLIGTLTEKIIMNQVFHPNVMQLAQIQSLQPLSPSEKNIPPAISSSDALLSFPSKNNTRSP